MKTGERAHRAVEAVERACATSASADQLLERVAGELRTYIPHDASMVVRHRSCDDARHRAEPDRGHGRRPVRHLLASRVPRAGHGPVRRPRAVVRRCRPCASRSAIAPLAASGSASSCSPQGYSDELRGALQTGDTPGASSVSIATPSHAPFDEDDVDDRRAPSAIRSPAALRTYVREASPWLGQPSAPGLLVVDRPRPTLSRPTARRCAGCATSGRTSWTATTTHSSTPLDGTSLQRRGARGAYAAHGAGRRAPGPSPRDASACRRGCGCETSAAAGSCSTLRPFRVPPARMAPLRL